MFQKVLESFVPVKWMPWVLMAIAIAWLGWQTNDLYAIVERHYNESHNTIRYAQQTCIAVHVMAHMDPNRCEAY